MICCQIIVAVLQIFFGINKIVPNLGNKTKYVLHCRNLQLHLSIGMKLVSVNRILKFNNLIGRKNTSTFTQMKENMQSLVLKKTFLSWWIIVSLVKQWKILGKK